ncbi:MAG: histidine triad nucleotide-binding protein [Synergistaceae bacterium]|jgi:histidine triad (HIT) family protein|nr:histidine triad nucleotide-binding protein [Synergistaceae bacterium]
MSECVFCKIAKGEIPAEFVYRDEKVFAVRDVNPQAPTHILVIPVRHVESAAEVSDPDIWSSVMERAVRIARDLGLDGKRDDNGFRLVINTGIQGGQTVPHLHLHLLSGRNFGWPPG